MLIPTRWVDKKSMRSLRKTGFVRRYMVLTQTRLYYLTSQPSPACRDEIHFEVNIDIINDLLNRDYLEKGCGKFDIVTPSRHLTIKCPFDEKLLWMRDIQAAREAAAQVLCSPSASGSGRASPSLSLYRSVPTAAHTPGVGKKLKTLFRGGGGAQEARPETFSFEQARALSE